MLPLNCAAFVYLGRKWTARLIPKLRGGSTKVLIVKCFYFFHSRLLWFGAAYRPLPYTVYQFFMNVDSTGLEVSANKGGSMFPTRDRIIIAWNWNLKFLPGLYWVLWRWKGMGKNRIIVLEWLSLTIEWNKHCSTEGEGSNKRSSGEFLHHHVLLKWIPECCRLI